MDLGTPRFIDLDPGTKIHHHDCDDDCLDLDTLGSLLQNSTQRFCDHDADCIDLDTSGTIDFCLHTEIQ